MCAREASSRTARRSRTTSGSRGAAKRPRPLEEGRAPIDGSGGAITKQFSFVAAARAGSGRSGSRTEGWAGSGRQREVCSSEAKPSEEQAATHHFKDGAIARRPQGSGCHADACHDTEHAQRHHDGPRINQRHGGYEWSAERFQGADAVDSLISLLLAHPVRAEAEPEWSRCESQRCPWSVRRYLEI